MFLCWSAVKVELVFWVDNIPPPSGVAGESRHNHFHQNSVNSGRDVNAAWTVSPDRWRSDRVSSSRWFSMLAGHEGNLIIVTCCLQRLQRVWKLPVFAGRFRTSERIITISFFRNIRICSGNPKHPPALDDFLSSPPLDARSRVPGGGTFQHSVRSQESRYSGRTLEELEVPAEPRF